MNLKETAKTISKCLRSKARKLLSRRERVIISAAEEDRAMVEAIRSGLPRMKFDVIYITDVYQAGDILQKVLDKIRDAKYMIAVNSPNTTPYCHEELGIALGCQKRIIIFSQSGIPVEGAFINYQTIYYDLQNLDVCVKHLARALTDIYNQTSPKGIWNKHKKGIIIHASLMLAGFIATPFLYPQLPVTLGIDAAISVVTILRFFR